MKKQDLPEVSTKNTKEQILAAYEQALEQLNKREVPIADVQKLAEKVQLTDKVTKITNDSIVSELGSLKSKIISQLDTLSSNLLLEFKKLSDIQVAIAFEKQHLEDLYGIKASAQGLAALIQAREENKLKFEEEFKLKKAEIEMYISNQKQAWKEAQEDFDKNQKEVKAKIELQRAREEEEYIYNRDLNRRKDHDVYLKKCELEEKKFKDQLEDIESRQKQLVEQEQQVDALRTVVANHPALLEQAVKEAEERLRTELTKNHEFEKALSQKDYEGQLLLKKQALEAHANKIKEQEALLKELTAHSNMATQQVQDIACKALESSAQRFRYQTMENKASASKPEVV